MLRYLGVEVIKNGQSALVLECFKAVRYLGFGVCFREARYSGIGMFWGAELIWCLGFGLPRYL